MKKLTTRDLVYMAMYAALFIVLDQLAQYSSIFRMANGGSLNLGTVILLLASYHLGWKKGLIVCVVANLLMYVTGSMNFYGSVISLFFDYIFAYCAYAFASCFPNVKWLYTGIIVTNLVRLACSTFSGCVAWETELWASIVYNAGYMIPTMIADLIIVPLIDSRLQKLYKKG